MAGREHHHARQVGGRRRLTGRGLEQAQQAALANLQHVKLIVVGMEVVAKAAVSQTQPRGAQQRRIQGATVGRDAVRNLAQAGQDVRAICLEQAPPRSGVRQREFAGVWRVKAGVSE